MATPPLARPKASPKNEQEFLDQLYRGGELLTAGKVIEAKDHLEKAHQLQPKNEKAQNLLGLAYFKLGLLDRAAEIYELLVRENPADPTLRVNLGLVYLKSSALDRAIREFETATDLSPDHKKAHNYLGLALAQAGNYGKAREHFLLAGSDAMAERMDRALSGERQEEAGSSEPAAQGEAAYAETGQMSEAEGDWSAAQEEEVSFQVMSEEEVPISELMDPEEGSYPNGQLAQQDWGAQLGLDEPARGEASSFESLGGALSTLEEPVAEAELLPEAELVPEEEPVTLDPAMAPEVELQMDEVQMAEAMDQPMEPQMDEMHAPEVMEQPVGLQMDEMHAPEAMDQPMSIEGAEEPAAPMPEFAGQDFAEPGPSESLAPSLAQLGSGLQQFGSAPGVPFQVGSGTVAIQVNGEMMSRVAGLSAVVGQVQLQPEFRRTRGRASDKPFGEGPRQLMRALGAGMLLVESRGSHFFAFDLAENAGYFREELVFAFQESVSFENGRLASPVPPDLELVYLSGEGSVLLQLKGALQSIEVRSDRPVSVPLEHLVGWSGNVEPRIVPLLLDAHGKPSQTGVEIAGEGFALFTIAMG